MALTPKQEKFCLVYHETSNASEAYRQAYDCENSSEVVINNEASTLKKNHEVAMRLAELKEDDRKNNAVTVASITRELEEARKLAMTSAKGVSAAVSAALGKAKLHGLLIDRIAKTEVPYSEWSEKDIDARIGALGKETGIVGVAGGESPPQEGK